MVEFRKEINKYNNNRWRNKFHFDAPYGLINDPNGLVQYKGEYYIFFQWNPNSCKHENKHWGLTKTKDFKNYKVPKIALSPEEYYDKNGCYSGSAVVKDNILEVFYTGNVKDVNGNRKSYQCKARIGENGDVNKLGPVIENKENGYTEHFRDPYIFKRNEYYYMVLGIQTTDNKGRCVIYKSLDLDNWIFEGELKTEFNEFGFMWECPALIDIGEKDLFILSPQGLKKEEFKYQNIYQSGYILGDLDLEKIEFKGNDFKELDKGFDFYAPQVFTDDKGRKILIGWMGLPEEEVNHKSSEDGWIYSLTMPRELILKDNKIYQRPVSEMRKFREELKINLKEQLANNIEFDLEENSYEMNLNIKNINSKAIDIKFMLEKDSYCLLKYDFDSSIVTIDRSEMGYKDNIRKFIIDKSSELKLDMYVDKSAVEIFIQEGKEVASLKLYPKESNTKLSINSNLGNAMIDELNIWKLGEIKYYE